MPRSPDSGRRRFGPRPRARRAAAWSPGSAPRQKPLYSVPDHGAGVSLRPEDFGAAGGRSPAGWEALAEPFLRLNQHALAALDVRAVLAPAERTAALRLVPGGRAGAVPLRSGRTGHVVGGLVVQPRFGWPGVGRVLGEIGWHAGPDFLDLPMVPGSGREVPPWVLAGPVLARLAELMRSLRRGYETAEEVLRRPRGRLLWPRYLAESLTGGRWDRVPCRFPDLSTDPQLRRVVRWTLERIHRDLVRVGMTDRIALVLAELAVRLIEAVSDVTPKMPSTDELRRLSGGQGLLEEAVRRGVEAIAWVVEERGLGGGRELDGLAWQLPLDRLWESYVESVVRKETAVTGGTVKVGRLAETTFPVLWSDPSHRSLGHLVPDIVVRRGRSVRVVDAKYKAHLAELDEQGWREFADDAREAHRADVHQVLAYASLFDADDVTATLVYPLRRSTWEALHARRRDISAAELTHAGRRVRLELRGLAFGDSM